MGDLRTALIDILQSLNDKEGYIKNKQLLLTDISWYKFSPEYLISGFLNTFPDPADILLAFETRYEVKLVKKDKTKLIKLIKLAKARCNPI